MSGSLDQPPPGAALWRKAAVFVGVPIVLLVCAAYVYTSFHWASLGEVLVGMDLVLFVVGGVSTVIVYWALRTLRWMVLMRGESSTASFVQTYMMTALSAGLSSLTPFQSGEAGKVEWLRLRGRVDRQSGYSAFAIERLLDLGVVSSFALVGMATLTVGETTLRWSVAALLVAVVAALLLLRFADMNKHFGRWFASARLLVRDGRTLAIVLALTVASWLVVALGWWVSLASISVTLGLLEATGIVGLVTVVNIVSAVPWALGVLEVGTSQLLMALGEPAVTAQAGAIILRGYAILVLLLAVAHLLLATSLWKGSLRERLQAAETPNGR